ncbi:MAG: mechanosensitive ion channel family protein [Anaerofustis stercorihominis]|nr:mechanosensitive ion channel family protein [Anaerofustis stercorihominis]
MESVVHSVTSGLGLTLGAGALTLFFNGLLTFIVCWFAGKFVLKLAERIIGKIPADRSLHSFLCSVAKVVVYFIIVLIVASSVGIDVTSLLAIFSVAGLAVSLALQGLLSNVASGVVLMVTKAFKSDDYVEVNGISGTVEEIGLIYTKIITPDNKVIHIPNSEISGAKIINYSTNELRRVDIIVSASYDNSTQQVESAVMKAVSRIGEILTDPAPFVKVSDYGASAISYTVRVWTKSENYWTVYFALMEGVRDAFEEDGVEMTYNHINVHMVEK